MPIYEYRCDKGHTFEVMQRMTDDPLLSCQTCSAPVERVYHPVAVHFKGSGFYSTDYGSKKRSRELKEAAEGTSKGDSKSKEDSKATPSDSKPSTKSEPSTAKPASAD